MDSRLVEHGPGVPWFLLYEDDLAAVDAAALHRLLEEAMAGDNLHSRGGRLPVFLRHTIGVADRGMVHVMVYGLENALIKGETPR